MQLKSQNNLTGAVCFFSRLVLSAVFIWASYHKIADPAAFAKVLYGYDLFPGISINILAIVIPFIELAAGFSLLMGFYPRSALFIINTLLCLFILAVGINLLRGHAFDCGCFAFGSSTGLKAVVFVLVRDILFLGAGLFLWKHISAS